MPTSNNNVTTKSSLVFNSNETLEMCDVKVSQEGKVEIATKSHHSEELDRMGRLTKKIGGSLAQNDEGFTFTPYQKGTGKSPYEAQVIVGSTTLKMSKDKVYISFAVPRHLAKALMPLYIQSEMDEVKRRIEEDVYDKYVKTEAPSNAETHPINSQARLLCADKSDGAKAHSSGEN